MVLNTGPLDWESVAINFFLIGLYLFVVYTYQWCNLTLAQWFWASLVCLRASEISQICLFGRPTGQANFWKSKF